MPEALELLLTRRSVSAVALGEPAPASEALSAILTAAVRVPDHGKLAPWRFIIISGAARHALGDAIAEAFRADNLDASPERIEPERQRLARAPLVVCVVSRAGPHVKIPEWEQMLSAGAVCMNMLHAAHAQGFGAQWLTEWYAYDERIRARLGIAPAERIAGFVHIGTPTLKPEERPRPQLASVVTYFSG